MNANAAYFLSSGQSCTNLKNGRPKWVKEIRCYLQCLVSLEGCWSWNVKKLITQYMITWRRSHSSYIIIWNASSLSADVFHWKCFWTWFAGIMNKKKWKVHKQGSVNGLQHEFHVTMDKRILAITLMLSRKRKETKLIIC